MGSMGILMAPKKTWASEEQHRNISHIGSMYGIYANIWGMVHVTIDSKYMDPMGWNILELRRVDWFIMTT